MATLNIIADEIGDALDRPFDWMFKERIKSIFRHEAATIIRQAINKDGLNEQFKIRFNVDMNIIHDSTINCSTQDCIIRSVNPIPTPVRYTSDEPFTFVGTSDGRIVYLYTKLAELPYSNLTESYSGKPTRYIYQNNNIYINIGDDNVCGTITSITDNSSVTPGTLLVTSINHNLSNNIIITITSTSYNSDYIVTVIDDNTFTIIETYSGADVSGSWIRKLNSNETCITIEGVYPFIGMLDNDGKLNTSTITDDDTLIIPDDLIQSIKLKLLSKELSIIDSKDKIQPEHIDN